MATIKRAGRWYTQLMWLVAIWVGSVVALGVVAGAFRLLMHWAGMRG
ncbi:DUF2474 domain-containing protein [Pseudomonas sp. NA-150]